MKGLIHRAILGTSLGAAVALVVGCVPAYREIVDPCWPERYNYQARQSIRETFNTQAANGHALDQTVWNQHFKPGTDELTRAGEEHLKYLARRRPVPDPRVSVQPAYDAKGNAKALEDRRVQVVQDYLAKIANQREGSMSFDVAVRDQAEPGLPTRTAPNIYYTPAAVVEARQLARDTTPLSTRVTDSSSDTLIERNPQGDRTRTGTTYQPPVQGPVQRD